MLTSIRGLARTFLDFLYPPLCISCDALITRAEDFVCPSCWSSIKRVVPGDPLLSEVSDHLLADANVRRVAAAFVFERRGTLQKMIHALKYSGLDGVGVLLGGEVGKSVEAAGIRPELIVPVPLHRARERDRGYNQAERIARGIAATAGGLVQPDAIRRVMNTGTQTKLTIDQRRRNVAEAFAVPASYRHIVAGSSVLLVDDVITTGSTISACAEALRRSGVNDVAAASVALADHAA